MKNVVHIYFGQVVREMRQTAGLTQEELGEKAGLQRNFISSLELAQKQPSLVTVFKIAKALNISADELIGHVVNKIKTEVNF